MQPDSGNISATPSLVPKRRGIFYGWFIVAAGFVSNVAYSEQFNSSYGVFVYHVDAETGWGRTVLSGVKTAARIPESITAMAIGPLLDRYGARYLMAIGAVLMSAAFMLLSTIKETWELYLYMSVVMPIGAVCLGSLVTNVAVSNWFVAKRGRAVGILNMGQSLGTMLLPIVASAMIELWGWRQAWFLLGVAVPALVLPAALLVRRRPEDMGLHPDGIDPSERVEVDSRSAAEQRRRQALMAADVVWSRSELVRSPLLWIMVFAWGFAGFAVSATNLHMVPFFMDMGYPLTIAAGAVSLRSAIAFISNPAWGFLAERLPPKRVAAMSFLVRATGLLMWLLPPSPPTLIAGLVFIGLGVGGNMVLSELLWAVFFGRISLGTVRSIAYPLQTVFSAVGPLVMGMLYDASGSYRSSFMVMVAGFVLATALIQLARPPKRALSAQ